jgi:hypothetical protein
LARVLTTLDNMVQELADVADALADCLGPDSEQDGDGDLGQCQAATGGPRS